MVQRMSDIGFGNKNLEDNYEVFYQDFNQNNFLLL